MKGYKVSSIVDWGKEINMQFTINHTKAVQMWNDAVRKMIRERDCVTSEDFGEEIQIWREDKQESFFEEDKDRYEFLYAVAPIIVYKDNKTNRQIADVVFVYKSSYEYNEWDVGRNSVVLEEIEIIE